MSGSHWIQKLPPDFRLQETPVQHLGRRQATGSSPIRPNAIAPPEHTPRLAFHFGGPRQRTYQVGILRIDTRQLSIQVIGAPFDFRSTRFSRRGPLAARRQLLAQR